jgi:hypothetical protein
MATSPDFRVGCLIDSKRRDDDDLDETRSITSRMGEHYSGDNMGVNIKVYR